MDFLGMDTGQCLEHAERLRTAARRLESRHAVLHSVVQASVTTWRGPDAEAFRASWTEGAGHLLDQLVGDLDRTASELDGEVEGQESASEEERTASGTSDGTVPGLVPDDALHGGDDMAWVSPEVGSAWEAMGEEDQKKVLEEIVNQELERQGHPPIEVYFDDLSSQGLAGYWSEGGGLRFWRGEHITFDSSTLDSPDTLNTAVHEARHAAQDQWVDETEGVPAWQFWREDDSAAEYERIEREYGVTREEIEDWRENFDDYTDAPGAEPADDAPQSEREAWEEEYQEYREQPVEEDAFDAGDGFVEQMTLEDLEQYKRDAGV